MDPFVADIETEFPNDIISGNLGDDHYVEFRLGFLPQSNQVVLMSVGMIEGASYLSGYEGIFDLRFGIRLKYLDRPWNVTAMDFSQSAKRLYIHPNNRETVRNLVARAIDVLIDVLRPSILTMSTFDQELPERALVKYRFIEACLHANGYRTVDSYRSNGRDRWHFSFVA